MKIVRSKKQGRVLVVSRKRKAAPAPEAPGKGAHPLIGKTVICEDSGAKLFGVVRRAEGSKLLMVQPAAMHPGGFLAISKESELTAFPEACLEEIGGLDVSEILVKKWSALADFETKALTLRDDAGSVRDYQDVVISGMASLVRTEANPDRDREFIMEGAFSKSIRQFMTNPVMLADHENKVHSLIGSWTKVNQLPSGLGAEGKISNAPGLIDIRFKVMERHLRAMSIGGMFFYQEGSRAAIEQVDLFEITLTPIPADQDALFQTRAMNLMDAKSAFIHAVK